MDISCPYAGEPAPYGAELLYSFGLPPGQTEEGSANVCSPCEVHLICMLRVPGFQYCGLYKSFRYIIQEKPRVHFLLNMHGFAGVEAGHSDGVFQIAVGALNLPPRKIESGEPLRWELREGKDL